MPSESRQPRRQTTNTSVRSYLSRSRTIASYLESSKASEQKTLKLKPASYPVYQLKWEKLKSYLEKRFPSCVFDERRVERDHYIFDVPESLKSDDEREIMDLRDEPDSTERRVENSPDPE